MIKTKTVDGGPRGEGIPGRDQTKEIEQLLQEILGNGYFEDKNSRIQKKEDPCYRRKSLIENVIF